VTEASSIDDLIRAHRDAGRNRDAEGDDHLRDLRERIATEEGVGDMSSMLAGGNATQLRDSAVAIRHKLGSYRSPSLESAIAAQRRAQAERNARMNH
jgi:hypothetical protein